MAQPLSLTDVARRLWNFIPASTKFRVFTQSRVNLWCSTSRCWRKFPSKLRDRINTRPATIPAKRSLLLVRVGSNWAHQTPAERCRSGRTGRSRKPLWVQAHPGFESLSLRHFVPIRLLGTSGNTLFCSGTRFHASASGSDPRQAMVSFKSDRPCVTAPPCFVSETVRR